MKYCCFRNPAISSPRFTTIASVGDWTLPTVSLWSYAFVKAREAFIPTSQSACALHTEASARFLYSVPFFMFKKPSTMASSSMEEIQSLFTGSLVPESS